MNLDAEFDAHVLRVIEDVPLVPVHIAGDREPVAFLLANSGEDAQAALLRLGVATRFECAKDGVNVRLVFIPRDADADDEEDPTPRPSRYDVLKASRGENPWE